MMVDLPAVTPDDMNMAELRSFIPQMLKTVTGKERPGYGKEEARPLWWPGEIPWSGIKLDRRVSIDKKQSSWTDALRNIVRKCYQHYGCGHLLGSQPPKQTSSMSPIKVVNNLDGSVSFITNNHVVTLGERDQYEHSSCLPTAQARVPVITGSGLQKCHFPQHPDQVENLPAEDDIKTEKAFIEVFICFFCEKDFHTKCELQQHQVQCEQRPPELLAISTPPRQKRMELPPQISPKIYIAQKKRPSKELFISGLGLLRKDRAEVVKRQCSMAKDIDCFIVDDVPSTPRTPTTPRTPKSLMSQLSREPMSPSGRDADRLDSRDSDEDSISGCSKSDIVDDDNDDVVLPKGASLLKIDLASPLGQLVVKHLQSVPTEFKSSHDRCTENMGYSKYCRTPVKSSALEKLRVRKADADAFPVTYRFRKNEHIRHTHEFKFSKKHKKEFMLRMKTGLNRRSRVFLKYLRPCSVQLDRLSKNVMKCWIKPPKSPVLHLQPLSQEEIEFWTSPVKSRRNSEQEVEEASYPEGPALLSANIDQMLGLKRKDRLTEGSPRSLFRLSQMVSEDAHAEVTQQQMVIYKSLLNDLHKATYQVDAIDDMKLRIVRKAGPASAQGCPGDSEQHPIVLEEEGDTHSALIDLLKSDKGAVAPNKLSEVKVGNRPLVLRIRRPSADAPPHILYQNDGPPTPLNVRVTRNKVHQLPTGEDGCGPSLPLEPIKLHIPHSLLVNSQDCAGDAMSEVDSQLSSSHSRSTSPSKSLQSEVTTASSRQPNSTLPGSGSGSRSSSLESRPTRNRSSSPFKGPKKPLSPVKLRKTTTWSVMQPLSVDVNQCPKLVRQKPNLSPSVRNLLSEAHKFMQSVEDVDQLEERLSCSPQVNGGGLPGRTRHASISSQGSTASDMPRKASNVFRVIDDEVAIKSSGNVGLHDCETVGPQHVVTRSKRERQDSSSGDLEPASKRLRNEQGAPVESQKGKSKITVSHSMNHQYPLRKSATSESNANSPGHNQTENLFTNLTNVETVGALRRPSARRLFAEMDPQEAVLRRDSVIKSPKYYQLRNRAPFTPPIIGPTSQHAVVSHSMQLPVLPPESSSNTSGQSSLRKMLAPSGEARRHYVRKRTSSVGSDVSNISSTTKSSMESMSSRGIHTEIVPECGTEEDDLMVLREVIVIDP